MKAVSNFFENSRRYSQLNVANGKNLQLEKFYLCYVWTPLVSRVNIYLDKFVAGIVDTGGNFATGALITVVHLDLRISPRIENSK
jgi:hypothetical protein